MNTFLSPLRQSLLTLGLGGMLMVLSLSAFGDPGDTTWVQTYTWEAQDNPATAYESPGRRWFNFPSGEDTTYRKILMYHRLKCFENGTAGNLGFPCGEWDYLTYNHLFDHTGELDSTALFHPLYLVNDVDFETADLILAPEGGIPHDTVLHTTSVAFHEFPDSSTTWSDMTGLPNGEMMTSSLGNERRHQWMWHAHELDSLGWSPDEHVWRWALPRAGNLSASSARRVTLRARWTAQTSLESMSSTGWTTLVDGPVSAGDFSASWVLDFQQSLVRQEGLNLVLDLALEGVVAEEGNAWNALGHEAPDSLGLMCAPQAPGAAQWVRLDGGDRLEIDPMALWALDSMVTVECWIRGDAAILPANTTLFEGVDAADQRQLNVHAPWSNGRMYWDAGFDGGYDRIDQAASETQYEGQWVHWAFTKDAAAGVMQMHVNGQLFHSGGDKDNVISDIVRMNLGGSAYGTNGYPGDIAAFRVWDAALSSETLALWRDRASMDALLDHPQADALLGAINMLGENGEVTNQGALAGWIHGDAGRFPFAAREAFLDPAPWGQRPALVLQGGAEPMTAIGEAIVATAVARPPVSLTQWEVQGNDVGWMDLHYGWPAGSSTYVLNDFGDTLAVHAVEGEATTYNNQTLAYWGAPFEVIDRYELARYITPYGINLTLGPDGWAWVFDVTDYAPLLKDSVELQCGNWQELLDLKFAFIEGTPPRDVKRVDAFWKGLHYLSNWDETVLPHAYAPGEDESMWRLKTRASGHDFGQGNNCGEFCYNTHSVKVDGQQQWSWEIMQECADNPLYPQGGTWIYDRAGWCPGAPVRTEDLELTPLVEGQESFEVEYDVTYDPYGNYRMEGQIIGYGSPNMTHDVEIMDILAPNEDKLKSRFNPVCEQPVVRIRNNGSAPLDAVNVTFGISGGELETETLSLEPPMAFLEERDVALPYTASAYVVGDDEETLRFEVDVEVANALDEEGSNGWMSSSFQRPPTWQYNDLDDNRIIVWTKTNNVPGETSVEITRADGGIQWARSYSEPNTTYRDTVELNQGCYRMTVLDSGDDGLDFWANNDGSGFVRLKKVAGGNFHIFESDFGKSISQAFYWATNLYSEVEEESTIAGDVAVFPNPFQETLTLVPAGLRGNVQWQAYTVQGQLLEQGQWSISSSERCELETVDWPKGIVVVVVHQGSQSWTRWVVHE